MKRRHFIREIVLLGAAPLLWLPRKSVAQLDSGFTPEELAALKPAAAGGGASCAQFATNDGASTLNFGTTGSLYWGQGRWSDASDRTICKLEFDVSGNVTGSDFRAEIHAQAASPEYDIQTTALATSDTVAGQNWASKTRVTFTFASPYTTTGGTLYSLVLRPVTALGDNNITGYHDNNGIGNGYRDTWNSSGAASNAGGNDTSMAIWTQ